MNKIKFQDEKEILAWAKVNVNRQPEVINRIQKMAVKRISVRNHMLTLIQQFDTKNLKKFINTHRHWSENYVKVIKGEHKRIPIFNENTNKVLKSIFEYAYLSLLNNDNFWELYGAEGNSISKSETRTLVGAHTRICPYCDKSEITNSNESNIDHFLPKSKLPLLSIFWKNFVIACVTCNSKLVKGEACLLPVLHPYYDEINKKIKFIFDSRTKKICVKATKGQDQRRAENFIQILKLRERYKEIWPRSEEIIFTKTINNLFHDYILNPRLNYKKNYNWNMIFDQSIQQRKNELLTLAGEDTQIKLKTDYYDHVQINDRKMWTNELNTLMRKRIDLLKLIDTKEF
ncbi:hypothetical protein BC351_32575 [Paenibacillus ferrarius]|uniref:HNH domain-containing protein n=1 Tax=Paenibacillus ferrarius TaxID=1469647 RepID=A0A1V4HEQ7_9BACL|nr:HNH endonuclease [Paenibacillus ferrarius]OPH52994.1 hypothetical protein BC351_32575 [Paenibacillus ferrarius]